jgi:hypothetical protein
VNKKVFGKYRVEASSYMAGSQACPVLLVFLDDTGELVSSYNVPAAGFTSLDQADAAAVHALGRVVAVTDDGLPILDD